MSMELNKTPAIHPAKRFMRISVIGMLALFLVSICSFGTVLAAEKKEKTEKMPNVVDNYDLFTDAEEEDISKRMKEVSEKQQCELVVVTISEDDLDGKTTMEYADDYFDYNGYGYGADHSGVLLLFSMENSAHGDFWISTTGYGITALTDAGLDYIQDCFLPSLKEQNFAEAVRIFASECDRLIGYAKETGKPYDIGNMPKADFEWKRNILIALAAGVIVAFLVTVYMRSRLKSVKPQKSAVNYAKSGSMNVTEKNDIFLYHNVTKQEKPEDDGGGGSSTHRSSSGRSHGGSGGSF